MFDLGSSGHWPEWIRVRSSPSNTVKSVRYGLEELFVCCLALSSILHIGVVYSSKAFGGHLLGNVALQPKRKKIFKFTQKLNHIVEVMYMRSYLQNCYKRLNKQRLRNETSFHIVTN